MTIDQWSKSSVKTINFKKIFEQEVKWWSSIIGWLAIAILRHHLAISHLLFTQGNLFIIVILIQISPGTSLPPRKTRAQIADTVSENASNRQAGQFVYWRSWKGPEARLIEGPNISSWCQKPQSVASSLLTPNRFPPTHKCMGGASDWGKWTHFGGAFAVPLLLPPSSTCPSPNSRLHMLRDGQRECGFLSLDPGFRSQW